jgi:hypothetical protein
MLTLMELSRSRTLGRTGSDSPTMLDLVGETLDEIARSIKIRVKVDWLLAIASGATRHRPSRSFSCSEITSAFKA